MLAAASSAAPVIISLRSTVYNRLK
jgi:hypothetical protein